MPNLGLTDHEANLLADYLIKDDAKAAAPETAAPPPLKDAARKPGLRYLVYSFVIGFSLCGILAAIYVSRVKKSR